MLAEVVRGPYDQSGAVGGTVSFHYPIRYVDAVGNASSAYYTGVWDPATNRIKDSKTGGSLFLPGAGNGDPVPPRIQVIEDLDYGGGESRRQVFWWRPIVNDNGELDYAAPPVDFVAVNSTATQRVVRTVTTAALANNASENLTLSTLGRAGVLYRIEASHPCWVVFYDTAAHRTADAGRAVTTDPDEGSGVLGESILTSDLLAETLPNALNYINIDTPTQPVIYARVTNQSGGAQAITLTLTAIIQEA